jgi:hypothetical protein
MASGRIGWLIAFVAGAAFASLILKAPEAFRDRHSGDAQSKGAASADTHKKAVSNQSTGSVDASRSEATFQQFCDLALQSGGGLSDSADLLELAKELDPSRLAEYARRLVEMPSMSEFSYSERAINILVSVWAKDNLQAAVQFALAIPPRSRFPQRRSAIEGVIAAWPAGDANGLIDFARRLRDHDDRREICHVLDKASEADPQGAIAEANDLGLNFSDFSLILSKWQGKDDAAARNWVLQQPAGRARDQLLTLEAMMLAHSNPEAAISWAELIQSQSSQATALSDLEVEWFRKDPAAAEKFVDCQQDPTIRDTLRAAYLAAWGQTDPAAAAKFLEKNPDLPHAQAIANSLLLNWTFRDPATAAEWIASFPEGKSKMDATTMLIESWCESDRKACFAWVQQHVPPGADRDQMLSEVATSAGDNNPELTLQIASLMSPSKDRERLEEYTATDWLDKNPALAGAWIRSSDLPDDVKARLLTPPPTGNSPTP